MNTRELNQWLIKEFPLLKIKYEEEIGWQEGDETGSHVVYGDVFIPYIEEMISKKNDIEIQKIFNFIEDLLDIKEKYFDEVIAFSVLEKLCDKTENIIYTEKFIKQKTMQMLREVKKYLAIE